MKKTQYSCPKCGGQKVEYLAAAWIDANTDKVSEGDELALAELYSEVYYCNNCQDHVRYLVENEVEADPPPSHWDVHPGWPVEDWQLEVANSDTRLGYHEWVANQEGRA